MYKLTPMMVKELRKGLKQFHDLFSSSRCSGSHLEELLYRAINIDPDVPHKAQWKSGGHDKNADINVKVIEGNEVVGDHYIQVKSGKIVKGQLELSGPRLGRFKNDFQSLTNAINQQDSEFLSIPHEHTNQLHIYRICYVRNELLTGLNADDWEKHGSQFWQHNEHGVLFSLRPTMSWQLWWKIPLGAIVSDDGEIRI